MDFIDNLYKLCSTIENEIADANEKIEKAGDKLSAGDIDYIDKLTHTLKSVKAVIGMMEGERDDEYSSRYDDGSYRYDGGSYARGRGSRAKRDSMGRYASAYRGDSSYRRGGYSRESGYSRDDFDSKLTELMQDAPNEHMRAEIERLSRQMKQM